MSHPCAPTHRLNVLLLSTLTLLVAVGCGGSSFLNPVLKIRGVTPDLGPSAGGTTIKIVGSGFRENTTVSFGGLGVETLQYVSPVELLVTLPALTDASLLGLIDVTVTNAGGEGADPVTSVLRNSFRYFASSVGFDSYRNVITAPNPGTGLLLDIDGDGSRDLLIGHRHAAGIQGNEGLTWFHNNADGTFTESARLDLRSFGRGSGTLGFQLVEPQRLTAISFDGDALTDVLVSTRFRSQLNASSFPDLFLVTNDFFGGLNVTDSFHYDEIGSASAIRPGAQDAPAGIAAGDLNGDGNDDAALVFKLSNHVAVLFGDGVGGFTHSLDLPVGEDPTDVIISDLNRDGRLDLAVSNFRSNNITIYYGNGSGSFMAAANGSEEDPRSFPCGSLPTKIGVGNFSTGDDIPDLVVANKTTVQGTISILEGDGFSGYLPPRSFATGPNPSWVTVEDLDGDTRDDIAVASESSNTITLLFQREAGVFSAETLTTGARPRAVLAAPLIDSSTGHPDLVTINSRGSSFSIHENLGKGVYDQPRTLGVLFDSDSIDNVVAFKKPIAAYGSDFDSDLNSDILVIDATAENVTFLPGTDTGAIIEEDPIVTTLTGAPRASAVADLDDDGNLDLVVGYSGEDGVEVWFGDGSGRFTPTSHTQSLADAPEPRKLITDQFGSDKRIDIVLVPADLPEVHLLRASSGGTYGPASIVELPGLVADATQGDWNGDGIQDLAVAISDPPQVHVLLGKSGRGGLVPVAVLALEAEPLSIAAADWDVDQNIDLAVALDGEFAVTILRGDGNGNLTPLTTVDARTQIDLLRAAEVNGDRSTDLIGIDCNAGQALIWQNSSAAGQFETPINVGTGGEVLGVEFFRPGSDPQALPDVVMANGNSGTVTLLRNISF